MKQRSLTHAASGLNYDRQMLVGSAAAFWALMAAGLIPLTVVVTAVARMAVPITAKAIIVLTVAALWTLLSLSLR